MKEYYSTIVLVICILDKAKHETEVDGSKIGTSTENAWQNKTRLRLCLLKNFALKNDEEKIGSSTFTGWICVCITFRTSCLLF